MKGKKNWIAKNSKKNWLDIDITRRLRPWKSQQQEKQPFLEFKRYLSILRRNPCYPYSDKIFRRQRINYNLLTYKDFPVLVQHVNQFGKILHKRDTGVTESQQKIIKKLIKQARITTVLPFMMKAKKGNRRLRFKKDKHVRHLFLKKKRYTKQKRKKRVDDMT